MQLPRTELCEAKSWTRQILSDAWELMNWDGLSGTPWQMVALELKLTKKVTADKEEAGPPLPRIVVERAPEVELRRFYVLSADNAAHGHTGGCPGCAALASNHEDNRMRDIHVGKRGSEAASEEQPYELRKTVRFEHEAPRASSSSRYIQLGPCMCLWSIS